MISMTHNTGDFFRYEGVDTINEWAYSTFGLQPIRVKGLKLHEELLEFLSAVDRGRREEMREELADMVIVLVQLIPSLFNDPRELGDRIDAKMQTNRNRKWEVQPNGTSKHRPTTDRD